MARTGGMPIIPPLGNIGGGACGAKLKITRLANKRDD
jgi:hypothetical protein